MTVSLWNSWLSNPVWGLLLSLGIFAVVGTVRARAEDVKPEQRDGPAVPLLDTGECWKKMPVAESGSGQDLPNWARAVAVSLPRTAAAMLQLDLAHRTRSPLDPVLRAKMRWVVAHENRCAYSAAVALADLKRAGAGDTEQMILQGDPSLWPERDRDPLEFARLLTVSAPTLPDSLFEKLRTRFGDKKVASMVLLAAYGNFQDRIILGLNLPMEAGGPLPPVQVRFPDTAFQIAPLFPSDGPPVASTGANRTVVASDPEWAKTSYRELQERLESQRNRVPRLPVPTWEQVKSQLPPTMAQRATKIVWNLVCSGYVPELAVPWSICTRTMWAETEPDRIFEESLFWIQTRSIGCNYCMGHCEMLLEVAGLDKQAIARRTSQLASSDWSGFPEVEQRAYAYARKLSRTPYELTTAEYQALVDDLGPDTAMATFWWLCRGLYMTRVSDGFQLPLERENVFALAVNPPAETAALSSAEIERLSRQSPEEVEEAYPEPGRPEAIKMLLDIQRGSMMGANDGWFGPSNVRYTWAWLAERHGIKPDETIPAEKFLGSKPWFARLDRNRDGQVTADDLDWSDRNPWVQQAYLAHRLFRRIDPNGDGSITRDEWNQFFDRASGGKDVLLNEDFRDALLAGAFSPGDMPSKEVLLRGLVAGEVGSIHEGPALDAAAPDFTLKSHDGTREVRLAEVIGSKPVVLVFGNYTCGPFRAMFPAVDAAHARFKDEAVFLAVHVREAHPTDGWHMESQDRLGVRTAQPRTYAERVAVAGRCYGLLKHSMPLLVDDIHDPVGHAYSGMPARLYVIDRQGKVAYKGGRGPFGFKPGEMEQALVMTLLDASTGK